MRGPKREECALVPPLEPAAMDKVLCIGGHELSDEHGAARVHAGTQKLHHVHIAAVLQDGNLRTHRQSCAQHTRPYSQSSL